MSKAEIVLKIETLLEQMSESVQKKYGGFKSSLWSDKIINVMVDEEEAIETIEHPIERDNIKNLYGDCAKDNITESEKNIKRFQAGYYGVS